ncbi:hypothetical protein V496_05522 [Pseudogymnoascus sp. VKM F-4515 (FW-2607)]|nr:hypothetical protein V496_05522 [Pseudogymnoascus sp. VKM F-4515 (FW-2607)]KFY88345.1 hypothetical protein V498_06813 [Pseudogymnoascus sp. VKM F-4517 (FW-2822)]
MSSGNDPDFADNAESTGMLWIHVAFPLTFIAGILVGIRFWWRSSQVGSIGKSDWCVLAALANVFIQLAVVVIAIIQWGFGHHVQYLIKHKGIKYVQMSGMYFYIYQIFYKMLVSFTKLSFLYLYLDIFTGPPRFRTICHVSIYSVWAALVAFTLATTFQCAPIQYNWNKTIQGHCFEALPFWYAHAAWNAALNIFVFLLPIPVIRSLQMERNQKAALMGVFTLGAFVCITSVMRAIFLDVAAKTATDDITFSTHRAFLWTHIESCASIICACLPPLKAPLSRILSRLFPSSWSSGNRYNLADVAKGSVSAAARKVWKDSGSMFAGSGGRGNKDSDGDTEGSQERIMGIKKTVDVSVVSSVGGDQEPETGGVRRDQFGELV